MNTIHAKGSLNGPISTHRRPGHSDTRAKTDAHKTVVWGHTPTLHPRPLPVSGYFKFSGGGGRNELPLPPKKAGGELSAVLKRRSYAQGAGSPETRSSHTVTHADGRGHGDTLAG